MVGLRRRRLSSASRISKPRRRRDFRLVAKLAGGETMVGAEPGWCLDAAKGRADAGRHFLRGLVGESNGENPRGRKAIGRNALNDRGRQGGRLAGAGASKNQNRAGLCGGFAWALVRVAAKAASAAAGSGYGLREGGMFSQLPSKSSANRRTGRKNLGMAARSIDADELSARVVVGGEDREFGIEVEGAVLRRAGRQRSRRRVIESRRPLRRRRACR